MLERYGHPMPPPRPSEPKNFIHCFETYFVGLGCSIGSGIAFLGTFWIICGLNFPLVTFFTRHLRYGDEGTLPNGLGWALMLIASLTWSEHLYPRLLDNIKAKTSGKKDKNP